LIGAIGLIALIAVLFLLFQPKTQVSTEDLEKQLIELNEKLDEDLQKKNLETALREEELKKLMGEASNQGALQSVFEQGIVIEGSEADKARELLSNYSEFIDLNVLNPVMIASFLSKEKISQLRNETGFYKQFPEKDLFQVNVIIGETTYISFIDLEENKVIYFRRAIGVTIQ